MTNHAYMVVTFTTEADRAESSTDGVRRRRLPSDGHFLKSLSMRIRITGSRNFGSRE